MRRTAAAVAYSMAAAMALPMAPLHAQGAGSAGAAVLQLLAGGRAAALSGAYSAADGDVDVIFYNPAGIARLDAGASVSYQRHVQDIGVANGAGAYRFGRIIVGVGAAFLDGGSIQVIEPDPDFGGQTGRETGATASASEVAARAALAMNMLDDRLQLGAAAGFAAATIANASQSAAIFDLGAQWRMRTITLGAALRNLGGAMSGAGLADADLPSELRGGATTSFHAGSIGVLVAADLVHRLAEERTGFAAGIEAGLVPAAGVAAQGIGAVARIGYNGTEGEAALGALQLGAGLSFGDFAIDYAYQNYDFFGSLHRFGVRWQRATTRGR
jgi:hypothetical protein